MLSTAKVLVFFYFCNAMGFSTNYKRHYDFFDYNYYYYIYEEFNSSHEASSFEDFLIMSKPYFEQAVQMCPTATFCSLQQDAGGNKDENDRQEVHGTKQGPAHGNDSSVSLSSTMSKIPSNTSLLGMLTTLSYFTGDGGYASISSDGTTMPTTGTAAEITSTFTSTLPNDERFYGPCCRKCSCSSNCIMGINCCIDTPLISKRYHAFRSCMSAYNKVFRQTSNARVNWPDLNYLVAVPSCDTGDSFDTKNLNFDDVVFVSTKEVIYQNKRHAACVGETNVKRWDLIATDCVGDLYLLSLDGSEFVEYVLESCMVYSTPPDDVDSEPFVCHPNEYIISSCNETGFWDFDDAFLVHLCYFSDHSYAYDEYGIIYANMFCLMCNKPLGYTMPQTCGIKRRFTIPVKGPAYKLLSERGLSKAMWYDKAVSTGGAANCSDNTVFDEHLKKCRKLFCPFQGFPTNGHCSTQRQFVAINRIFDIEFRLHSSKNMTLAEIQEAKFIHFHGDFFEALGFRGACEIVTMSFSAVSGEEETYVRNIIASIQLKSSQSCDEELTNQLFPNDDVTQRNISLQVGRTTLKVTVEPLHKLQNINYSSRNMTSLYRQGNECSDCYIAYPGTLLCPYFILDESEYCSLYTTLSADPNAVCSNVPFDDRILLSDVGSDVYYVCARDYKLLNVRKELKNLKGYDSGASPTLPTFWIVILLFLYIFSKSVIF